MAAVLGLSTYRWNNNLKSILLLTAFPFLLLLLLAILVYLAAWFLFADSSGGMQRYQFQQFGLDSVTGGHGALDFTCAFALAYWPYVVGAAVIWLLLAYFFNDALIHRATGARAVARADSPKLYNLLENLCISRGLTMPRLYIIDTDAMNAYASGVDQRSYSITVTSGLLAKLNDAELEAVLAHELTHILDRDVRLLLVTILFVGVISFLAQLLWRSLRVISFGRSRRGGGGVVMFVLAAAIVAGVGYLLALVLRFAISREREYLADAGSVDLTKHPEALISALRKIATNPAVPHVPSEVRQMFIENPPAVFTLFDTHPPIAARIKVLERLAGIEPQASAATTAGMGAGAMPAPARASAGAPTAPGWITGLTLAGSLGYALFLLYANARDPGFIEAVAAQLAPVTDAVAGMIPACQMADALANPALGISAVMIRHLFPVLVLVNALFGLLSLGYIRVLATHYARRLAGRGVAAVSIVVYLLVAVLSFYPLVGAPMLAVLSQQAIEPMGLGGYLVGAASPAVFFYCLRHMLALASAGPRIGAATKLPPAR